MPMNCPARDRRIDIDTGLHDEIERIDDMWSRRDITEGRLGVADVMYAPVASRFRTYGIELSDAASRYQKALLVDADVDQWHRLAAAEPEVLPMFESGA